MSAAVRPAQRGTSDSRAEERDMGLNVGDNVYSPFLNTRGEILEFIEAEWNSDGEEKAIVMWVEGNWSIERLDEIDVFIGPLTRPEALAICLHVD